jgi:hypothetical protein
LGKSETISVYLTCKPFHLVNWMLVKRSAEVVWACLESGV